MTQFMDLASFQDMFTEPTLGTLRAKEGLNIKLVQLSDKLVRKDIRRLSFIYKLSERDWEIIFKQPSLSALKLIQILAKTHRLSLKTFSDNLKVCGRVDLANEIDKFRFSDEKFCIEDEKYSLSLKQKVGLPNSLDAVPTIRSFLVQHFASLPPRSFDRLKQCYEDRISESELEEAIDTLDIFRSLSKKLALNFHELKYFMEQIGEPSIAEVIEEFIDYTLI